MGSTLVIYNPIAGRGRVQAQWPQVQQALHETGIDFEAVATTAPGDAFRMAQEAVGKYEMIVSVGGDGTVHEIVNGLMTVSHERESIPLAIIPLGTGDDFAKVIPPETAIGHKPFDWQIAVEKISHGQTRLFDVGRIVEGHLTAKPHYFINGLDVGFGAHALVNLATTPRFLKGFMAYLTAILKTMVRYPLLKLTIQIDDQAPFEQVTVMTAITNGRCIGNSFWISPQAQADDGLLDVVIGAGLSRLQILRLIPKLTKGTHVGDPAVSMTRARRVILISDEGLIVESDGEIPYTKAHKLTIDILPSRLRIVV